MSWNAMAGDPQAFPRPHNTVNIFPGQYQQPVVYTHPQQPQHTAPAPWHSYQQSQPLQTYHHTTHCQHQGPHQWQNHYQGYKPDQACYHTNHVQHHHHHYQHQHYAQQPYYPSPSYMTPRPYPGVQHQQHPQPIHQPFQTIQASPQQLRHQHYAHPQPVHQSPAHHVQAQAGPKPQEPSTSFWYTPAGETPNAGARGRNKWYGRTKAQVKADEHKYAQQHGRYNAREPGPINATAEEMFMVVEANGERNWRNYATIMHSLGPGRWDQASNGQMFYTRFNA